MFVSKISHRFQARLWPKRLVSLFTLLILTLMLNLHNVNAAALPAGVTKLSTVEGISEYRLANGLRILLAPDDSKATTTVNMTYLVGSRHENYGETGMAHLLEHMLFKGTPSQPNALGEFSKRGIQANGSTWLDRTNYYGTFASNADTLDWFLAWQADAMINAKIAREDLDKEMTVVRNEMERGENSPFRILMEKTQAAAFQWHNYGKSTIGARSDVENVDTNRLKAFYQIYYQPDNAVLTVTGSFDPEKTLSTLHRIFSQIPAPKRQLPKLYTLDPVQDGARQVTVKRVGGSPLLISLYHIPAAADPRFIDIDLATIILSDTPSGRLYKELVAPGITSDVFGGTYELKDPGIGLFGASLPTQGDVQKAQDILLRTIENTAKQPFTEDELKRAKNLWLQSWQRTFDNPEALGIALSETVAAGDWRLFFLQRDRVENAQLAKVQSAAKDYFVESNRTVGIYSPTSSPVRAPSSETISLDEVLKSYTGKAVVTNTEAFNPDPLNIQQLTQRGNLALTHGQLEFALIPKSTRGGRVSASINIKFGNVDDLKGLGDIAAATAALLDKGTTRLSRQEIEDFFTERDANVSFSGAGTTLNIGISTKREHLNEVLTQALAIVQEANFPDSQLDEYKQSLLTSIDSSRHDPQAIASLALSRHRNPWSPDDIRYVSDFDESVASIKSLSTQQLKAFQQRFYGASQVYIAAAGDFDKASLLSTIHAQLNSWPAAPAYTRVPDPFKEFPAQRFINQTPDKANAFYIASASVPIQFTDDDYIALNLGNFLLGLSENSRLWNRVREQDGLSYNVRSVLDSSMFEKNTTWTIYAIIAPENKDRLEKAIQEELQRVLKDGFTDEEVKNGIQSILNQRRIARSQDPVLVSSWMTYMATGRSFNDAAKSDAVLSKLTAKDVNEVIRRYLKPSTLSVSIAGDFKKP